MFQLFFNMQKPVQTRQTILGIDPGTNIMGYGVLQTCGSRSANLLSMGILDMRKLKSPYEKLQRIFMRTLELIDEYKPDELAIESQFYSENVQSMLKLGRAQGVAIAAALFRNMTINEYAPLKIKMALTGNGSASKEQVADMVRRFLHIPQEQMQVKLDATDAVAVAYCHFLQLGKPVTHGKYSGWKDYIEKNPDKIHTK